MEGKKHRREIYIYIQRERRGGGGCTERQMNKLYKHNEGNSAALGERNKLKNKKKNHLSW